MSHESGQPDCVLRNSAGGLSAAGQISRNNTYLIDGLSNDDNSVSSSRGGFSVDAIREFIVLSNNFSAEYGQASGAIINVVSRSGSNQYAGRGFYYHRDDALDATPAAARLTTPPTKKAKFEQKIVGGFYGGPIARDRAFFFASTEHTMRDQEAIVTSRVLNVFRPNEKAILPVPTRNPQVIGRTDVNLAGSNTLTFRYRIDRSTTTNNSVGGLSPRERGQNLVRNDQDFAVLNNHVFGSTALNEFRFQFARRYLDWKVDDYCPKCPTESRPSINLGKASNMPQGRTEIRWQFINAFTYIVPDKLGDHSFKVGVDASFIGLDSIFHNNLDGTFTFTHDLPFNTADARTYPSQYTRNDGDPFVHLDNNIYALFAQDQWKPRPNVTFNLGVRWDYEDVVGISHDKNNLAPRLGVSWDPWSNGRTSIRGGYGIYYDQIFLNIPLNAENAKKFVQTLIQNPGYPEPLGPNPNRTTGPVTPTPSTTQFAEDTTTPFSEQVSVGVQREITGQLAITADGVWARGYGLMRARDINYPDLNDPLRRRPNPNFQVIRVIETKGHSWYKALQVGITKRHSNHHSYTIAYTLSESERDTEDFGFYPVDQRYYDAERGPASNDNRHRFSASLNVDLPFGLRLASVMTARSATPYNITTGLDSNRDTNFNDRPGGITRNSARGDDSWQVDARLSKEFRFGRRRVEWLAEAFHIANTTNWTGYVGNQRSASFGKPTGSGDPRQIQLGVRVDF